MNIIDIIDIRLARDGYLLFQADIEKVLEIAPDFVASKIGFFCLDGLCDSRVFQR